MDNLWNLAKYWGGFALRYCRPTVDVLPAIAVGFMLFGIWWLGPHWQWRGHMPLASLSMRVLASTLVVMVPLLLWALLVHRRYRILQAENRSDKAALVDPCLPYIQAQERSMELSLATFLNNAQGRRTLYQLPWYLVVGEPKAGKTCFINQSNQRFALTGVTRSERTIQDQYLAHPIDWCISDEAVLIDLPGQILGHEQGTDHPPQAQGAPEQKLPEGAGARLWLHALQWLAERRSQRALNGVVLVIDIVELLGRSHDLRIRQAQQWRARFFELSRALGSRLPLYVVLNKIDLLEGFEQLLGRLPTGVREEVLGFTFSLDEIADPDAWLDEFARRFDQFVAVISQHTFDALPAEPDLQARQRLFSLQGALAGMRPMLICLFNEMLGSDRFTTPALVRGVFLTSVMQQGQTHNAFVMACAQPHRIERSVANSKRQGISQAYFVQRLFQQAIYPEAGLAGDNLKVARSKRRLLWTSTGLAALGVLLTGAAWHHYFDVNRDKVENVLAKGREFSGSDIDAQLDSTGRNLLDPLDQIRGAVAIYENYRQVWPGVTDLGLYQGRTIGPRVDEAYLSLLSRRFLPAIARGVIETINAAPPGSNQQLAALRVYRMLEDRHNRRAGIVEDWMARHWQRAFPGQGQVQDALMQHLAYALKYADADLPQYRERISEVQQNLRQIPMPQRVYMVLAQDAQEHMHSGLDLRTEIGPAFDVVYRPLAMPSASAGQAGIYLPPLLTIKGFKGYFEPRTEDVTELAMIDQWVLGERRSVDYSAEDRKALTTRLHSLYAAEYVDHWRKGLAQLEVVDFNDLSHAVAVLEQVTGPAAPFRRLLETVRDNVELSTFELPAKTLEPALPPVSTVETQVHVTTIRRAFSGLADLLRSHEDKPSYYEEVMSAVDAVHDYAKAVQDSPNRGKAAMDAVLARFSLSGSDPINTLQRVSSGLPEPMNRQVRKLADQTAEVLMIEALRELERRWDSEVYSFYQQRLAKRYPFDPAGSDASLEDFEAFLGPHGRLQQFTEQYLKVFIRDNIDALYSHNRGEYLVRQDVLDQLQAAERIRETFFNNDGALSVQFSLEPLGLSGNKRSSVLGLDGQLIAYSHGPASRVGLIWPNTLGESLGSKLTLVHGTGNSSSLGFQGPWSLFRLLSRGQLMGRTDTSVDLGFQVTDGMMRYRITAEKALNPFTLQSFQGFSLPRTLLGTAGTKVVQAGSSTADTAL